MCGIVGYIGKKQASPILLSGLERLEYRGYDSAGLAVKNDGAETVIVKAKGRLRALAEKTDDGASVKGCCGIGHTRWATHGEPSEINAHPHYSDDKRVIAVHNGIIENYKPLKDKLEKAGYTFYSQTDSEVAVKLLDYYLKKEKSPLGALARFMLRVRGSYALAVLVSDEPDKIFVARKDSPLLLGRGENESYLASDIPAILPYTRSVYYLENLEMATLSISGITFYNIDKEEIPKTPVEITFSAQSAEKSGFEHFMMKEIHEQPRAVEDTLNESIKNGAICLPESLSTACIQALKTIYIVGCGSAYHVGVCAQYVIEDLAKIPVRVELASEFRYRAPLFDTNTLVIVISQSGETADSLGALRLAKKAGAKTLAIVNVVGSSIAREADEVMYTRAGPEIAVATTKAYSTQLIVCYLLAIAFGKAREQIEKTDCERLLAELYELPQKIRRILEDKERLQWFASKYANANALFVIGRGLDYACALEGGLKTKEISYIHAEAYPAGELKHGTISLIEDGTLVVGVLTQERLFEKTVSNMSEVKSRGAYLFAVTTYGNYETEELADFTFYIPRTDEHFAVSLAVIPLQLTAYYISVARGVDVDKPRNLAKSVTVE